MAAALTLFFFCPKFVLWRGLSIPNLPEIGVPPAAQTAEVRRAIGSLAQLKDPLAPVEDPIARPIAWRLLFPLAWHYLHLPSGLFLAMPFVGCLVALGLVADLVIQRTGDRRWAFLAALAAAACPWFFVSTGWLAYFDSWMIAGLLLASFGISRTAFALACLLVPWIDERFLLGLPLCLLLRSLDAWQPPGRPSRKMAADAAIALLGGAVYIGLRLLLVQRGGGEANAYIAEHFNWQRLAGYSPLRCAEGLWMALRAGWFFAALLLWSLWMTDRRVMACLLAAALAAIVGIGMVIASDVGRTLCVAAPLSVAGILVAARQQRSLLRSALPAVAAANLLLPAAHLFTTEREPILYLYAEMERYSHPPPDVDPQTYVGWALAYARQQQYAQAESCLEAALKVAPAGWPHRQESLDFLNKLKATPGRLR